MTPQRSSSNILRIEPDTPVELALSTPSGLNVTGRFGPQMLFSLTGNRRMYVPVEVGEEIQALTLAPGQPFTICKRSRAAGRGFDWQVERKAVPPAAASPAPAQSMATATQIEHALKTAVAAAASAERFATEIGYTLRFSSEDVRAMGITLLISKLREAA